MGKARGVTSDLHIAAVEIATTVGAVFPCHGKIPLTSTGFRAATTDLNTVDYWWWRHPTANIGVAVPEGHLVIDVDRHHDGERFLDLLEETNGRLPETRSARTRHDGRHLWFTTTQQVRQGAEILGPGLDTRTAGRGYVIVPPSQGYEWIRRDPVAPAPSWLILLLAPAPAARPVCLPPSNTSRGAKYAEVALAHQVGDLLALVGTHGTRNHALNSAAFSLGRLAGAGLITASRVGDELLRAAISVGLPQGEAEKTILSGLRAGARTPKGMPA
jgi:hypothetical protein